MSRWKEFYPEDVPEDWFEANVFMSRVQDHIRFANAAMWTVEGLDAFNVTIAARQEISGRGNQVAA